MHRIIKYLLILALLCCISALLLLNKNTPQNDNDTLISSNAILSLRLVDNCLYLFESNEILKTYEINPLVLPSEDILMVSEGIIVKNVAEADLIVENFDG